MRVFLATGGYEAISAYAVTIPELQNDVVSWGIGNDPYLTNGLGIARIFRVFAEAEFKGPLHVFSNYSNTGYLMESASTRKRRRNETLSSIESRDPYLIANTVSAELLYTINGDIDATVKSQLSKTKKKARLIAQRHHMKRTGFLKDVDDDGMENLIASLLDGGFPNKELRQPSHG